VAVEPANSAVVSGNSAGSYKIQGMGAGFIPLVLNLELVDNIIAVLDENAIETCRQPGKRHCCWVYHPVLLYLQLCSWLIKGERVKRYWLLLRIALTSIFRRNCLIKGRSLRL